MKKSLAILLFLFVPLMFIPVIFGLGGEAYAQTEKCIVTLQLKDIRTTYEDKYIKPTNHIVYEEMHERRINAPWEQKVEKMEECLKAGSTAKDAVLYCFPLLKNSVDAFIKQAAYPPKNSEVEFKPYMTPMFYIKRETDGLSIDEERLYYDIYSSLRKNSCVTVSVKPETVKAKITAEFYKSVTFYRASFTTNYENSTVNRKHNIKLALSKINGSRIDPGQTLSFNKTVGKRTQEKGFAMGKIISGGRYIDGIGGGVCQASTTLYNAALLSGLDIAEVSSHSLIPSYIAPSFDAMVNSGSSDLKIVNNSDAPVFIRAFGTETEATVEFYGQKMPYRITTSSNVLSKTSVPEDIEVIDTDNKYDTETMKSGEKKRVSYSVAGLTSEGYLLYYKDGKLIDKKLIRKDVYRTVSGIIAVKP